MRLAEFILNDMERILTRWEAFAATCLPAAAAMAALELRDHAKQILEAIAADLSTPQTREAQGAKSMGLAPAPFPAHETAAQVHGFLRARNGYDIQQLASEYRALRASVLSLWLDDVGQAGDGQLYDVIRFNEAIDQALAESIGHFSAQLDKARNLLLGMLGHDMRTPLQTVQVIARHLARLNAGDDVSEAAERLMSSGANLQGLLDDLVDFNRTSLGLGINIVPSEVDIGRIADEQVENVNAAYPATPVLLEVIGNCAGSWDGKRLRQVLGNLIVNAIHHGEKDAPVHVTITGEPESVRIEVANNGPAIDAATLPRLFEPLARGVGNGRHEGLGLGLYIVREIAKGHGGNVEAHSADGETVFTVVLPRKK